MRMEMGPVIPYNNLVKSKKSSKGCVRLRLTLLCSMLQELSCYGPSGNWMFRAEVWEMHRLKGKCENNANCENQGPSLKPSPAQQSFVLIHGAEPLGLGSEALAETHLWEANGLWAIPSAAFLLNLRDWRESARKDHSLEEIGHVLHIFGSSHLLRL